jgi:SAM-dependent methyltransferase
MEGIYSSLSPEAIPWNIETPPELLVSVVTGGLIKPCRALDLGCGTGNYAMYLSSKGFEVTGIDISETAIHMARQNALEKGLSAYFIVVDFLSDLPELKVTFDFIYDWDVLHHIFPEYRAQWVSHVRTLLNPGGKYLSVCFHQNDPAFGGKGKYRKTPIGTELYFSDENELRNLFETEFLILESRVLKIPGKTDSHIVNYFLME